MKSTLARVLLLLLVLFSMNIYSQKMSIGYVYPAGGQRGTTFDIEIGGLNVQKATGVYFSGDGIKAEIINENNKTTTKPNKRKFDDQSSPQLADRLKVRVTIDNKAIPGLRDIRLHGAKDISNKLCFEVGQYFDVLEKGSSTLQKPNIVSQLPATFCGQIMPGEKDYFSFSALKGSKIVAYTKARAFVPYIADAVPGWFQAVISIYNSKGSEVAFNDDYRNNVDPVIVFEVTESDTYTLMIHDAIFRGREDFNYRIDVGEIPFIEYIYPPVGKYGNKQTVKIKGVNIEKDIVKFKPDFIGKKEFITNGLGGFISNPVPFLSIDKSKSLEDYSKKMFLEKVKLIYDSIVKNDFRKEYFVDLERNENFVAQITARKLGSKLDARLILKSMKGDTLAISDDIEDPIEGLVTHHADPVLKYIPKYNCRLVLVVEDVLRGSGVDNFYLLERKEESANFEVFVSPSNITIPKGGTATLMLDVVSQDKKTPKLNVELHGLPKGFKTSSLELRGNKWEISITAPKNAKLQKNDLKVLVYKKAKNMNDIDETHQAIAAENMMQAFYYTHHIPVVNLIAEVVEEAPFSLHFSSDIERNLETPIVILSNDTIVAIKILINRKDGFKDKVTLQLGRKNKQIILDPVEILPDEKEKTIYVKLDIPKTANFKGLVRPISVVGTVNGQIDKKGKRTFENAQFRETTPIVLFKLE